MIERKQSPSQLELPPQLTSLAPHFTTAWSIITAIVGTTFHNALHCCMCRVGQIHIYTVYTWYVWQGNYQIYRHTRFWPTLKYLLIYTKQVCLKVPAVTLLIFIPNFESIAVGRWVTKCGVGRTGKFRSKNGFKCISMLPKATLHSNGEVKALCKRISNPDLKLHFIFLVSLFCALVHLLEVQPLNT